MSIFDMTILAVGVWGLGLVLMFIIGKVLSRVTLASIERDDPNESISERSRRLRMVYRRVVTLAGMYWYISLPFVALMVVGVAVAIIYAFISLGHVPVVFVIVLVVGTAISLNAMVRSLLIRNRKEVAPGRAILEAEAPGLWQMTREVAGAVGTRPIDEIWLTPGTDLAVFERGSTGQRMKDLAPRALIIGAGVLEGFEQGAFRAVLAHEYGHFAHRDTAGGEIALRVTNGMMMFAISIGEAGYAVWWNLAFQFLRLYHLLFRRISHGATRLQEVLADRVAVHHYGLEAFRNGLTHVVRRSIRFEKLADDEIRQAVDQKRYLSNLYSLPESTDHAVMANLEQQVSQKIEMPTSEDNTHPSPRDRFKLGQRIRSACAYQADGFVWDLFHDRAAITAEMTAVIAQRIAQQTSVPVAARVVTSAPEALEPAVITPEVTMGPDRDAERTRAEIELKTQQLAVLLRELAPLKSRRNKLNIMAVTGGALAGALFTFLIVPEAVVISLLLGLGSGFFATRLYYLLNSAQRDISARLNAEKILKDELARIYANVGPRYERTAASGTKPPVQSPLSVDAVVQCPSCGTSYRPSDYRSDLERIYCSGCKAELPRS